MLRMGKSSYWSCQDLSRLLYRYWIWRAQMAASVTFWKVLLCYCHDKLVPAKKKGELTEVVLLQKLYPAPSLIRVRKVTNSRWSNYIWAMVPGTSSFALANCVSWTTWVCGCVLCCQIGMQGDLHQKVLLLQVPFIQLNVYIKVYMG